MIQRSNKIKLLYYIVSILLGAVLGGITYNAPISQILFRFRAVIFVLMPLLCIISLAGEKLIKKYDLNDELVIDDEMEDYFSYLHQKFSYNFILSIIIGLTLCVITFIANFHAPVMLLVNLLYWFVIILVYGCSTIDELISIIFIAVKYKEVNKG